MDQISLTQDLAALAQVILIDITLAGDNAVVVAWPSPACRRARSARPSCWASSARR